MTFTVTAHSMGSMPLPGPEVFWMQAWDEWFEATFWMLVARSEHGVVVINTGPPDLTHLGELWRGSHPSGRKVFTRTPEQSASAALAAAGVTPEEVTHVVLTPLVTYTLGALRLFPHAQYYLSRRGLIEDVIAPPHPHHLPREIFVPDDVLQFLLFEARDRVRLVGESDEITPGVRAWEAGVHHRSSLAVEIDTAAGVVIATDAAFSYRNVEQNIALGIGESYAEAMSTYARLRRDADILIPLYDTVVLERHPGGRIA